MRIDLVIDSSGRRDCKESGPFKSLSGGIINCHFCFL